MGGRFLNDFERATQALLCAAREQQRPNRVNRHPLPADDFADILRMQPQLIHRRPFPLHRRHRHVVGCCTSPLTIYSRKACIRTRFQQGFWFGSGLGLSWDAFSPSWDGSDHAAATAAAFDDFLMKLATVSLG